MVAVPLPFLVEGRQKKLATLNRIQHAAAVIDPGYGSTEQHRELLENGSSQHELNQDGRKTVEHFIEVRANRVRRPRQPGGKMAELFRRLGECRGNDAQNSRPSLALGMDRPHIGGVHSANALLLEKFTGLFQIEAQ